jgi:isoquinoline 1-oxidoreductase subunit beta
MSATRNGEIQNVSRRGFLKGVVSTGAFVLCVRALPDSLHAAGLPGNARIDRSALHPSVYLGIEPDGTVYIVAHRSEMGTTSRTSVPMILADELDADWKRVKLEQAIGDERYGSQNTDGSHSIREFYEPMRQAGATARMMLTQAAANKWNVPVSECAADLHTIVHTPSKRRLGYGELASAAAKLPVPKIEDLKFKPKSAWRYIGKGAPGYDLADVITGKAVYGMDARMDNMVYASIERPPVLGGKVKSFDDKETLKVAGVSQTVSIDPFQGPWGFQPLGGVAVIAKNTWSAFQGRKSLQIDWENGPNASYDSDRYKQQMQETARKSAKVVRNVGDVDAAFAKGGKIMEAEYYVPHLAHAAMEPLVAVADFRDGKVIAWAPTQNPQAVQETVAKAVGISKEDVICHITLLGGGFGRKSKPDYVAEAAILSKKLGRPVKVVWTREDDIRFDFYHSVAAMYMKAAVNDKGSPTAWLQRSVFPSIMSMGDPTLTYGSDLELSLGWTDVPFNVPSLRVENGQAAAQVRIGWLRSVSNIYHAFAVQTFADELAHAAGRDPLEYMLELIGPPRVVDMTNAQNPNYGASYDVYPNDTGRLRNVLQIAAEKSGWGKRKMGNGSGMGIAVHRSFLTYVANVVEVQIDDAGKLHIPRVETVVDAGLITNPEAARSQFEGAAVFGTSIALSGSITASNGAIVQSNFDSYPVARMREAPVHTNVHLVESDAPPAGVGEPGVPPFIPALCNAIFAATGKRIRELPINKLKLA